VSVTTSRGTYESVIQILIKSFDAFKCYHDIEKLIHKYENVDRDPYNGEILCGGNTYVFMDYERDILKPYVEKELTFANQIYNLNLEPLEGIHLTGSLWYMPNECYSLDDNLHTTGRKHVKNAYDLAVTIAKYKLFECFI
jgi:hypothetical protein